NIECLRINLSKYVHDLYAEHYKILMNKTKEDPNTGEEIPCSSIRGLNIVEMSIFPRSIYRFNTVPVKNPDFFFAETENLMLKLTSKCKGFRIAKNNFEKKEIRKNGVGGFLFPDFKTYLKATVMKTVDQWNKIESPERNPSVYGQFIFDKGARIVQCGKEMFFQQ
ncbi:LORF2 protein, partial [Crocuta crocuta]